MKARDYRAVANRVDKVERDFLRDLLASESPRQAIVVAQLLAYFPGALIDSRFRG